MIASLEAFQAAHGECSFDDSVFIAKHLAVVYSANPATREKGKYYMYRLLSLLPSAKLVDMYVSDEIDRIFDKVRDEFLARRRSADASPAPAKARAADANVDGGTERPGRETARARPEADGGRKTADFALGGAALVALGVGAYIAFGDSPKVTEKTYVVP